MTLNDLPVPFVDESSSIEVAGLTVEYQGARIAVYGQTDIGADQAGLAKARALAAWAQSLVAALEQQPNLPAQSAMPAPSEVVDNPFA